MSWVHETLKEFGQQLGLQALELGRHGVAQLEFQSGAVLALEPVRRGQADEVLVYLARPAGFDADGMARRALARAHHASAGPYAVQVALRGAPPDAMLLALVRIPERDFTLQALGQAVDYLGRWFDALSR